LNVALTYNVRPEAEVSTEILPSNEIVSSKLNSTSKTPEKINDVYAEWDTFETIDAVRSALASFNDVIMVEADENAFEKFKEYRPDIVFNIAEGINGISREAQIPAMLDMLNIPYTGSDPLTLATCLDKARTKEILSYHKIRTAKFLTASNKNDLKNFNLNFPVIIKPVAEGSSKGIFNNSYVENLFALENAVDNNFEKYNQPSLIEEFLSGREFTVAIVGNDGDLTVLPVVEINFDTLPGNLVPIYSYEAKWIVDKRENPLNIFTCPAIIDKDLENKIKEAALKTFKVLNCKDWSRIDIRLDATGEPNIIEINPLPGILPDPKDNSCFPKAARALGWNYSQMLNNVLYVAAKRHKLI
jgi:D-alanine-D-alanine ligase